MDEDDFSQEEVEAASVLTHLLLGVNPSLDASVVLLEMLKFINNLEISPEEAYGIGSRLQRSSVNKPNPGSLQ